MVVVRCSQWKKISIFCAKHNVIYFS
jgi:hypothetical protein